MICSLLFVFPPFLLRNFIKGTTMGDHVFCNAVWIIAFCGWLGVEFHSFFFILPIFVLAGYILCRGGGSEEEPRRELTPVEIVSAPPPSFPQNEGAVRGVVVVDVPEEEEEEEEKVPLLQSEPIQKSSVNSPPSFPKSEKK